MIVWNPETGLPAEFTHPSQCRPLALSELMNCIAFGHPESAQFDASFMSRYDAEGKCFHYYVERLVGKTVDNTENPGSAGLWMPIVNAENLEWDKVCGEEFKVYPNDNIEWKFLSVQ